MTPDQIIAATAQHFGYTPADLVGPRKPRPLALARQIAMYLCREFTDYSLPELGVIFQRDHTTVLYGEQKIRRELKSWRGLEITITAIRRLLPEVPAA
jgi:chromosomal replication initiator protein